MQDLSPPDEVEDLNPTIDQADVREAIASFLEDEITEENTEEGFDQRMRDFVDEGPRVDSLEDDEEEDDEGNFTYYPEDDSADDRVGDETDEDDDNLPLQPDTHSEGENTISDDDNYQHD